MKRKMLKVFINWIFNFIKAAIKKVFSFCLEKADDVLDTTLNESTKIVVKKVVEDIDSQKKTVSSTDTVSLKESENIEYFYEEHTFENSSSKSLKITKTIIYK